MAKTKIEWATHTANWQAGCTEDGPECVNCYARIMSARLRQMDGPERYAGATTGDGEAARWTRALVADVQALHRNFDGMERATKPRRTFVGSMTDLFHDDAPTDALSALADRVRVLGHRARNTQVVILLTKRPSNLARWQRQHFPEGLPPWAWAMTTAGTQPMLEKRLPGLLEVQAPVRGLSIEPLLGPVDLSPWLPALDGGAPWVHGEPRDCPAFYDRCWCNPLQWVIVGGESGRPARPMHPAWVRSLRDQCSGAGVPFLFKQWGAWIPRSHTVKRKSWHAERTPDDGDWRRNVSDDLPWGTLQVDGKWWPHTSPWNGHDDDGHGGEAVMLKAGKSVSRRSLDGVEHDGLPLEMGR